ncbi:MucBP domain-containing protein, partial [Enterococcus faecalis]|nr:MucBP domain-containing protein [Enterococcus faecalis]
TFKNVVGNISGKFGKETQTVTFIFEKNPIPTGTVTVSYQDTDGNKLSEDIILTGTIGDSYTADKKTFEGYTFDTVKGSSTGTYLNESQTVVFIYKKEPVLGNITLKQSGFINATDRGYIKPNFYKVTYYDKAGNILKTEEIDKDTTLSDKTISTDVGSEYTVYSKVTYECYSIDTGERLVWGDYELVANDPELTSGILKEPNLTIEYTFKDLSWA